MMKRHPDGTWRNTKQPMVASEAVVRARWIEAEIIHLKRMGLPFDAIAEQISRVGRGEAQALVAIPQGITFPADYTISRQACHKAFRKAIAASQPWKWKSLANSIPRALRSLYEFNLASAKVTRVPSKWGSCSYHSARINGYAAPQRHELTGKGRKPLTLVQLLQAVGPIGEEDEK